MIVFCTPDTARPSGGVRAIYRAVDLLNAAGLEAAVLHRKAGFRCEWFASSTRVVYPPCTVDGHDVLVVPEAFTPADMDRLPLGVPKVVFNQNASRTFWSATRRDGAVIATTADHPDVAAVLSVSEHDRILLERALPRTRVVRLHHWIDDAVFGPAAPPRRHRILVMPRKRVDDFRLLVDLLDARSALAGDWELVVLDGQPEADVARQMGAAALFVALGRDEGFGLPVAEALACGCPVVGFHGGGGRELFGAEYAVAVEDGDVGALATWIEEFVGTYVSTQARWEWLGEAAIDFVASTYSRERSTADLIDCFGTVEPRSDVSATALTADDVPHPSLVDRARTGIIRIGRKYTPRSR